MFDSLRSLASRLLITLFVFGFDVTVKLLLIYFLAMLGLFLQFSGIIEAADPFAVGDFLFNPIVLAVAAGRAVASVKRTLRNKIHYCIVLLTLIYFLDFLLLLSYYSHCLVCS